MGYFSAPLFAADVLPNIPAGTLQVKLTLVATNLHNVSDGTTQINPTCTAIDGSGRLFITTLGGAIRVADPTGALLVIPYLNTTTNGALLSSQSMQLTNQARSFASLSPPPNASSPGSRLNAVYEKRPPEPPKLTHHLSV